MQRRRLAALLGATLLILVALSLRIWHDRNGRPPASDDVHAIEQRVQAHPDNPEAQLDWGIALQRQNRFDEAVSALSKAARLDPSDARPFAWLGLLALARHHPTEAKSYLQAANARTPSGPEALRLLAELHSRLHEAPDAIALYERLTHLTPNDPVPWQQLGRLYAQSGQWSRGYDAETHAATLDPSDLRTQRYLGKITLTLGRFAEAQQAYAKVLAQTPDDPAALAATARITLRLDPSPAGLDHAKQQIDSALARTQTADAYLTRGQIHLMRREYAPAIADFKAALGINADLISAYGFLSQAYAEAGQPDLARQASAQHSAALARHTNTGQQADTQEITD
jgi:tetratricopeptide (TPR) repeat protein